VPRKQIAETLSHLRELFRQVRPSNEWEDRAHERREILTRNLLSNLLRTKDHPTLHVVLEIADAFSLTLDGAHRLFGYELERIREYDLELNAGRTHIIETYPFERDRLVDLPAQFGRDEVFARNATERELIVDWDPDVPIRTLEAGGWQQPDAFYVRVGTEDSLGSSLPPGAIALVVAVDEAERSRPNPKAIYLLQFGNGYRCSRCVVTRGKLLLLTSGQNYRGPQQFACPEAVRVVGRVRMFALGLPVPDYPSLQSLPISQQSAALVLPWEQPSMDRLFKTEHRRFRRSRLERPRIRETMEAIFHRKISGRTERRYRRPTSSLPHVDLLIQLTLTHLARYTDVLRLQRPIPSDRGRYSLDTLLNSRHLEDASGMFRRLRTPVPQDRWMSLRKEFIEWPALLSLRFPQLREGEERFVRLPDGLALEGLEPPIARGSIICLEKSFGTPQAQSETTITGWGRRLYALRKGTNLYCGYLDRNENQYVLIPGSSTVGDTILVDQDELREIRHISGVAVPV